MVTYTAVQLYGVETALARTLNDGVLSHALAKSGAIRCLAGFLRVQPYKALHHARARAWDSAWVLEDLHESTLEVKVLVVHITIA